jgi:thiosulfate dehydrogenase [quinone] large subunit
MGASGMTGQPHTATLGDATPRDPAMVERFLADTRFAPLWLALRVGVGWFWLEAGWLRLNGDVAAGIDTLRDPLAIGLTLAGIAVILGALTGPAAFLGGFLSSGAVVSTALLPAAVVFAAAVGLTLAWKTAGWIGLDRWLLPLLGMPWRGGTLFDQQARGSEQRIERQS